VARAELQEGVRPAGGNEKVRINRDIMCMLFLIYSLPLSLSITSADQLQGIKGIGPSLLEKIRVSAGGAN
jgi:hypothetical protein